MCQIDLREARDVRGEGSWRRKRKSASIRQVGVCVYVGGDVCWLCLYWWWIAHASILNLNWRSDILESSQMNGKVGGAGVVGVVAIMVTPTRGWFRGYRKARSCGQNGDDDVDGHDGLQLSFRNSVCVSCVWDCVCISSTATHTHTHTHRHGFM